MFNPHAEPIINIPVYKRIGFNEPQPGNEPIAEGPYASIAELVERERIWKLIVQTASGVNPPAAQSEYEAPEADCA